MVNHNKDDSDRLRKTFLKWKCDRDKFMVIGSDGLWDMMTPMQVRFIPTVCPRSLWPFLCSDSLYENVQDFLDIQYVHVIFNCTN